MRILLTGGSACGKSTYAEALAVSLPGPRYYIAAMRPYDDECLRKIARHREMRREKGFITIERHTDIASLSLPERGCALLECLCNLTANEMFDDKGNMRDPTADILRGVEALEAQCGNLIVVTNEVGADGGEYGESTLEYIRILGGLNRALAARFDTVYELICGIPICLKGVRV